VRLFLYLFLGQLVGDFILQSSELVRLKRVKMYGVYPHVGLVTLATAVAIWGSVPTQHALIMLGLVAAFHLLLDRLSIVAFSETDARQVFIFMADQVAHIAVLAGIAWAFTRYGQTPVGRAWAVPLDDVWLTLLCGVLAVTFGGAVFLFEVVEAVAPSDPKKTEGALMGYSIARLVGSHPGRAWYLDRDQDRGRAHAHGRRVGRDGARGRGHLRGHGRDTRPVRHIHLEVRGGRRGRSH
jgi:hypothetical protein